MAPPIPVMKLVAHFVVALALFAPTGAANPYSETFGEIDSTVAVRINQSAYSQYFVEKSLARDISLNGEPSIVHDGLALEAWIESFVERCVLAEIALGKELDKDPAVLRDLEVMTRHMLSNPRSPGYPVLIEAIHGSRLSLADHQRFREAQFSIQYDHEGMKSFLAGTHKDDTVLLSYRKSPAEVSQLRAREYNELYRMQVNRPSLSSEAALRGFILELLTAEADCRDARELGLSSNAKFLEDKKNYLYRRIVIELKQRLEAAARSAPGEAIESHFNANREDYYLPETITFAWHSYPRRIDALRALARRESTKPGENIMTVDVRDVSAHGDIIPSLCERQAGAVVGPIAREGKFYSYLILEKAGRFIPELSLVYEKVARDRSVLVAEIELAKASEQFRRIAHISERIDRAKLLKAADIAAASQPGNSVRTN